MPEPAIEVQYRQLIENSIKRSQCYYRRQVRRYRSLRTLVIASSATVPVLAAVGGVSDWLFAALGSIALVAESIQQLYQFRDTSQHAMATANDLESELRLYVMAAKHYAGRSLVDRHTMFVERTDDILDAAGKRFLESWRKESPPPTMRSAGAGEP